MSRQPVTLDQGPTQRFRDVQGLYDLAIKVAFPLLLGASGWGFNTLWSHSNDLAAIRATRYTRKDAEADNARQDTRFAAVAQDVATIKEALAERRGADKDTARRLDRIEASLARMVELMRKERTSPR